MQDIGNILICFNLHCPQGESPIHASVKGMCKGATRRIRWANANDVDLHPLFVKDKNVDKDADGLAIDITVAFITTSEEYQIFSALRTGNMTYVSDLIDNHVGVNAVDEWGQTPLMIAVQMKYLPIIAALLNTRMPKVDVNAAKPVSTCEYIGMISAYLSLKDTFSPSY